MPVWVVLAQCNEFPGWKPEAVFSSDELAERHASMGDMIVYGPFAVDAGNDEAPPGAWPRGTEGREREGW